MARWHELQRALLAVATSQSERRLRTQAHPKFSPIGWHLEHCVFVECQWIRSALLSDHRIANHLAERCLPELAAKPDRGRRLPPRRELLSWSEETMRRNRALFIDVRDPSAADPLRGGDRILHFLVSHHAQHLETLRTALWQFETSARTPPSETGTGPRRSAPCVAELPGGPAEVGGTDPARAHDNELPRHRVRLRSVRLAEHPATNRDWGEFIAAGGYRDGRWWTPEGWRWWNSDRAAGSRAAIPARDTNPDSPVVGVSRYEAGAYARFRGGRLPHEYEWETAHAAGLLRDTGRVWEWCANLLHPYPGFRPFPYREYSLPWFDGRHYVLKGGSGLSEPEVKRASFRNYYTPDTRHIATGVRLAFEIGR